MRQMLCRLLLCTGLMVLGYLTANAQEKKWVSGSVKDPSGNPVAAATIAEKGTSNQTATDAQGLFRIQVAAGAKLLITAIGFGSAEVPANGEVNVTLQTAASGLDEVVVTALGIRRQKKSLGYGVQEIKGRALVEAREPNVTNALSGMVAGLQVVRSGNGPGGSSKIVLRGYNSLTGNNQPLIVVDGIPLDNTTGVQNNDYWNPEMDQGNNLFDINPEDIENISVLKGAASAALYGSRAGNGAILITTKSGRKTNGLGITVGQSLGVESIFTTPDRQSNFAQGTEGNFNAESGSSWGPKITGQEVTNWAGKKENLHANDNLKTFFGTGINSNTSLSFSQQFKGVSLYSSMNYMNDKSFIPGVNLKRLNLMTRMVAKFGKDDRWTTDFKVQYSNSKATNRPQSGNNSNNYASVVYNTPVNIDFNDFVYPLKPNRTMLWWPKDGNAVNPYWNTKYRQNYDKRGRVILNGSIKYAFTDWLDAEVKAGADIYNTTIEAKVYAGSPIVTNGSYSKGLKEFQEANYSTLITAKKDNLFGKLGGMVTIGGNLMDQRYTYLADNAGELQVPDFFHVGNGKNPTTVTDEVKNKKINSVFGTFGVNWDGYLFLEGSLRNDWSSALAKANRSYAYPALSLSYIFTESFKGPKWLNYGKLRASTAVVGNDMDAYQLYNTYVIGRDPNSNTTAKRFNILFDSTVTNEKITSVELGAELRLFNNRLGLDFSYYHTSATNQLINLPMDPGSGYEFRKINAGKITNTGFEVTADAKIIASPAGFNWNTLVNFSMNRNKIIEIYPKENVIQYALGSYDDVHVVAAAGELYGQIYGSAFSRVTDPKSEFYGQLILNADGAPQKSSETRVNLGNQQAKALLGVTNSFSYKNFNFSFLVDARFGGKIFSATNANLQRSGMAAATVVNGERNPFVVSGVVAKPGGGYETNKKEITPQRYWAAVSGTGNLGITEANLYDASSVRVRNVTLSYELPKRFLGNTPIQRARVGVSCNNVWLISSHLNGQDPESVLATGNNAQGFEYFAPPTTRLVTFNLSLTF
ncbi:SusC/RagA family TonB-linked outer membrane protein [Pseudoflavitalea sp. G-6-1-2]|uniref:SusC/RagA family TonB-linked outer membrane protein n=1 Tax=Pseudoflavitalea sp. G-6-1-2 TaxID=2728841 RepID=UPI00146B1513|nr:SusC/RagA family TonB-linked outer membrane protein [Pseudoflavitalea sp. G-6-1-2]NML20819.1 SusC/RagA family TonB-linked outer membrane protein [Pseudoflavitalea sp. G-6-1-2]